VTALALTTPPLALFPPVAVVPPTPVELAAPQAIADVARSASTGSPHGFKVFTRPFSSV